MITKSYKDNKGNRIIEYKEQNGLFTKKGNIKLKGKLRQMSNNEYLQNTRL